MPRQGRIEMMIAESEKAMQHAIQMCADATRNRKNEIASKAKQRLQMSQYTCNWFLKVWHRIQCSWLGHDYYVDDIGMCIQRFCNRCDLSGEVLVDYCELGEGEDGA